MLFQLSINSRGNGYSRVDVIISYVLLVGALVLEIISVCRALLSTWTCSLLHRRGRGWEWPLHVITSLGQRVHPASRRLWSGSIGQYNLFHLCTRNTNEIGSRLAMKLGLQDWWNKMHFSGTFSHSEILSMRDIKKLVLQALQDKERALQYKSTDSNSRGRSLQRWRGVSPNLHWYGLSVGPQVHSYFVWNLFLHSWKKWPKLCLTVCNFNLQVYLPCQFNWNSFCW